MKLKSRILLTLLCVLSTTFTAQAGPVGKGSFTITKPGKYTLIRNLAAKPTPGGLIPFGIAIDADDVDIDLGGFTIGPAPGAEGLGFGIVFGTSTKRVRIHNGRIQGVQQAIGAASNVVVSECIIEQIHIADCSGDGIHLGGGSNAIRSCVVTNVAGGHHGIVMVAPLALVNEVSDCSVLDSAGQSTGINSGGADGLVVRRCVVQGCEEGFHVSLKCKLFDNITLFCTTPITGNPKLVGVND